MTQSNPKLKVLSSFIIILPFKLLLSLKFGGDLKSMLGINYENYLKFFSEAIFF